MQPGRAVAQQRFAETRDYAEAEVVQRRLVVLQLLQTQANPARQLGAAARAEAHNVRVAGDRHNTGNDGNLDAGLFTAIEKVAVGIGVVEELGYRAVGAGLNFAAEVVEVRSRAGRLW